jgi:hypothetical protein
MFLLPSCRKVVCIRPRIRLKRVSNISKDYELLALLKRYEVWRAMMIYIF